MNKDKIKIMEDKKIEHLIKSEHIEEDIKDDLLLDVEELRYKHIVLRNLQKTAILAIEKLEAKEVELINEVIELKESITSLTETNSINQKLMIGALTNNNNMKDDYRNRIQALEKELAECKK
tara:strand:+ start:6638 stop:7003 length:366 start_codon:yes stop_codon:yes gene_type:complete